MFSGCGTRGLQMPTPLKLIARVSGPETSLWNRNEPCRRMACTGRATFFGRPPMLPQHIPLEAGWPKHKRRYPVGGDDAKVTHR